MRVLYVTPSFYPAFVYGGTTASAWGFSRGLDAAGCEVVVLTTNANGATKLDVPERAPLGSSSGVIYCNRWLRHAAAPSLVLYLAAQAPRTNLLVLNATFNFTTFPSLIAARRYRVPLVWAPRGAVLALSTEPPAKKTAWLRAMRALLSRGARAHCTSDEEAAAMARWFPQLSCFVVPNGVDIPATPATGSLNDALHIVTIGRLDPIKGLDRLLGALPGLPANWRCTIAGDGPAAYRAELSALARSLGVEERVSFVGHVDQPARERLLRSADVYVCASHSENFGQSIAEALAMGVAVIVSTGTPWSGVVGKDCGLWVENTPEALTVALQKMHALPRTAMGARGRAWMERDFSWAGVSQRWLAEASQARA